MDRFDNFEFNKNDVLGHGAFAIVYKGRYVDRKDVRVAIKVIQKKHFPRAKAQSEDKVVSLLEKEIKILKELSGLKHENLVALLKCHESPTAVYLVMEYCNSGDLADYLNERATLSEVTIQHFLRHMVRAIEAIYKMDIVHRDLKPQNMLLCNPTRIPHPKSTDLTVKLADFGFARFLQDGVMAATLCGSPMYMAPEVLMSHKYCAKADLWSLGTIIFQCLSSKPPFYATTPNELRVFYEMNRNLEPKIPASCSPLLRDLLIRLLKRDAKDRIEFDDFFNHSFLSVKLSASAADMQSNRLVSKSVPARHERHLIPPSTQTISKSPSNNFSNNRVLRNLHSSRKVNVSGVNRPASPESSGFILLNKPDPSEMQRSPGIASKRNFQSAASAPKVQCPLSFSSFAQRLSHSRRSISDVNRADGSVCPVKQVKVHASSKTLSAKAVPVPSQKLAYAEMEERKNTSVPRKSDAAKISKNVEYSQSGNESPARLETRNLSIEHMNLPETHFIVQKRRLPHRDHNILQSQKSSSVSLEDPQCTAASSDTGVEVVSAVATGNNDQDFVSLKPVAEEEMASVLPEVITREPSDGVKANEAAFEVDNLKYLSASTSDSCASLNVRPSSERVPSFSDSISEEEDDINFEGPVRLPFVSRRLVENSDDCLQLGEHSTMNHTGPYTMVNNNFCGSLNDSRPNMDTLPSISGDLSAAAHTENVNLLAKLRFVVELVDMLINVAENKSESISVVVQSKKKKESDMYRRAEQLVVYVRALHMLSSALLLAQRHISDQSVTPSSNLQHILNQLNEKYHSCLVKSQELVSLGLPGQDPAMAIISAERIMYKHAIELCQSAALDELFGKSHLCPHRYHTAYMMFHTLSEQVSAEADKLVLSKYKTAVEKRLRILERQGHVQAVPSF